MTSIVNYKKHDFSDEFKGFAKDMGFIPRRCKPFSPETKGKVESSNRFIKWLYAYEGKFTDEDDLKRILNQINIINNSLISVFYIYCLFYHILTKIKMAMSILDIAKR